MCRHIAYWGPEISPAELVLDAPHSLLDQCTTAREMSWGQDNMDGWGVAWHDGERTGSIRAETPLTKHSPAKGMLRTIEAKRFVAHVRQKTPGSATHLTNCAPFSDAFGNSFTHNGYVPDFRNGVREQLLAKVSPYRAMGIRGDTDSEVLFALIGSRLDDGAPPSEAVRAVSDVAEVYGGRYNVLLLTPTSIVATRWDNSLYLRADDAVIITSEPLDDRPWRPVPERTMVIVDPDGVRQEAM